MRVYIVRRLLQAIPTLFVGSIAIWGILYMLPGDPAMVIVGDNATPEALEFERERLGLNDPLPVQYLTWISHILRGDFGTSYFGGADINQLLGERGLATLQLSVVALLIALLISVPLALLAAMRPDGIWGKLATTQTVLGLSVPSFWLGTLLILVFSIVLGWLPAVSDSSAIWENPGAALRSLALPGLTLGVFISAVLGQFLRQSLSESLEKDYVRTARSAGISERSVVGRHALRNALLPFITILGLQVGTIIGGAVVTESVFNYPGLGQLVYTAISQRDYVVVQSVVFVVVVVVTLVNLAVDVIYAVLDPRIALR